ncbi:MgtC/SapB family protein [Lactobacillus rodentium]|uniref:Magnesium transporter MgtC n=1 Tax=Lactobacillus rodentium TaxID=947835 RepID=A0A2Z6TQ65_9LACO|nr:MgtC/SapB family protein [Lactobacillus rodentium]MCR1894599.1 MgtC/SapB family protein [Lactobacillus rodentium]GBG04927.1 magnesium transporter MgtC [Lactobacillus rodentium]
MSVFTSFSTEIDWFCRLLIAALCGGAIGYERATQRKSAGMRTHMVVAVAAALFMLVSKYGFFDILNLHNIALDPSRIAAQIVTGISFIGAGTILVRKEQVSGLTTAAGVWATAAIGMAIGAGMYFIGIICTVLLFLIQILFHDDSFINFIILHVRFNANVDANNTPNILQDVKKDLEENEVEQISMKILDVSSDRILINVDGVIKNRKDENDIIMSLEKNQNIHRVLHNRGGM